MLRCKNSKQFFPYKCFLKNSFYCISSKIAKKKTTRFTKELQKKLFINSKHNHNLLEFKMLEDMTFNRIRSAGGITANIPTPFFARVLCREFANNYAIATPLEAWFLD